MPIYIGWCFLDLNWTFYRALLPIYIKNDTVVSWPTTRARLYLQIHVRYLFWYFTCAMTQFSSLLYYDHCPVPRYLIGEVPITLLLNQQTKYWICRCMYVWQTIALVWNITLIVFATCRRQYILWSLPCPNVPEMNRLLCCCVGMI